MKTIRRPYLVGAPKKGHYEIQLLTYDRFFNGKVVTKAPRPHMDWIWVFSVKEVCQILGYCPRGLTDVVLNPMQGPGKRWRF